MLIICESISSYFLKSMKREREPPDFFVHFAVVFILLEKLEEAKIVTHRTQTTINTSIEGLYHIITVFQSNMLGRYSVCWA